MARLPSEQYIMQQMDGLVVLFEDFTECEIVRFDPSNSVATMAVLEIIRESELADEDRCFACFWAGYFHAYACPDPQVVQEPFIAATEDDTVTVTAAGTEVARFDPSDANAAARAQKAIYDSVLSSQEKSLAHFWSGYFYALACDS